MSVELAQHLIDHGIPVVVCRPNPAWTPDGKVTDVLPPKGWHTAAAVDCDLTGYRPGIDVLALVAGHGLDVVDVDSKDGGSLANLPDFEYFGETRTPSGGVHRYVRSTGIAKISPLSTAAGHVGDYAGGTEHGGGRMLAYLPGSTRLKYAGMTYELTQRLDVPAALAAAPDAVLVAALQAAGGRDTGEAGRPSAQRGQVQEFLDEHDDVDPDPCHYGRATMDSLVAAAYETVDGDPTKGRHGWANRSAVRAVELIRAGCASSADLQMLEEVLDEIKPEGGTNWWDVVAWALGNADGSTGCAIHGERPTTVITQTSGPFDAVPGEVVIGSPVSGAHYFGDGGLQVMTLAQDVLSDGALRVGGDSLIWSFRGGVWSSDKNAVRDRVVLRMGERYRNAHAANVDSAVRSLTTTIACDPVPEYINFRNGLLDWRSGQIYAHGAHIPSTVQLPVVYDPAAQCPAFDAFLAGVVAPDVVATIWELIGYLMYSGNPLHKAVMLTGTGRNGKGTLLHVIEQLLGVRNLTAVSLHDLVNTRFAKASLFGKLANIAGDIDASYLENTATFKAITGGDTIQAEHKGRDAFDFRPWAVPVFSANKIPPSADTTTGYLSRWLVVPFPHDFSGREDRTLANRLHQPAEIQGIAAKAIAALGPLLARGDFQLTESMIAARDDFQRGVDQVRTWLADCCDLDQDHPAVPRAELYQAYDTWARRDGYRPVRSGEFYGRLDAITDLTAVKVRGTRGYKGLAVVDRGTVYLSSNAYLPHAPQGAAVS